MIIDARNAKDGAGFRPYTMKGAVSEALANIPPGGSVDVTLAIDAVGRDVPLARLQAYVAALGGLPEFMTRKLPPDQGIVRIYRRAVS